MISPIALRWLEDELFFSLCSRHHFFKGNLLASTTCQELFGQIESGTQHDFPCLLDAFEQASAGRFGAANSIIEKHTILPFFAPFQSGETVQRAISAMKGGRIGSIKYQLGLITGRFGAEHPLKACPKCAEEDAAAYGVAYWHLKHQYPGVLICPKHLQLLEENHQKRRWAGRFSWTLPYEVKLAPTNRHAIHQISERALLKLADTAIYLATIGFSRTFQGDLVSRVYENGLRKFVCSNHPRRDWGCLGKSFVEYSDLLRPFHPFGSLPGTSESAASFIQQMVRKPRGHSHPLRHLVMIGWLFEDFMQFITAYDRLEAYAGDREDETASCSSPSCPFYSRAKPPLQKVRRPKILKTDIRSQMIGLLAKGVAKSEVCSSFNVSLSTVNKLLNAEPTIREAWLSSCQQRSLAQHRHDLRALIDQAPNQSAKTIRERAPKNYAWLYRNDRSWLLAQTSALPSGRLGNYSKIDWQARDRELEQLLRSSILSTNGSQTEAHLTRAQIYALVPSLPNCLEKRDQYPKTRALLLEIETNHTSKIPKCFAIF